MMSHAAKAWWPATALTIDFMEVSKVLTWNKFTFKIFINRKGLCQVACQFALVPKQVVHILIALHCSIPQGENDHKILGFGRIEEGFQIGRQGFACIRARYKTAAVKGGGVVTLNVDPNTCEFQKYTSFPTSNVEIELFFELTDDVSSTGIDVRQPSLENSFRARRIFAIAKVVAVAIPGVVYSGQKDTFAVEH